MAKDGSKKKSGTPAKPVDATTRRGKANKAFKKNPKENVATGRSKFGYSLARFDKMAGITAGMSDHVKDALRTQLEHKLAERRTEKNRTPKSQRRNHALVNPDRPKSERAPSNKSGVSYPALASMGTEAREVGRAKSRRAAIAALTVPAPRAAEVMNVAVQNPTFLAPLSI